MSSDEAKPQKAAGSETALSKTQPIPDFSPWTVFQAALKAVPALKYALAVLGIVSAIAIIKAFGIDLRVAVFGTIIMVVLMIALVLFAALTKVKSTQIRVAALVLMWSFLGLTILSAALLFTSAFFGYPRPLNQLLQFASSANTSESGLTDPQTSEHVLTGRQVRFQFDNTGSWFGTYAAGVGVANVLPDSLLLTIESGKVRRNPSVDGNRSVRYISAGIARSRADSWEIVSQSTKHEVNWQFKSESDVISIDGMRFSVPLLDPQRLIESWIVVELSDGEGSVYASSGHVF